MNKIKNKLAAQKEIGFMGHVIAGYPDNPSSVAAAKGICEAGADYLEVQFPFSDPMADGPTIELACYTALEGGFKLDDGFQIVEQLSKETETAILIMTYANIVFKYGVDDFIKRAASAGCQGIIVPDFPIENDEGLALACKKHNIALILIAAPGADEQRIKTLSETGSGFLYTVARRGITGKKTDFSADVISWLSFVKEHSSLPIAAGFGIRTKEQIDTIKGISDIAVVGSYFVNQISSAVEDKKDIKETLQKCTRDLL